MKKIIIVSLLLLIATSCGSNKSFQSFFNDHKKDIGVTAFQVPSFMRSLLSSISPETSSLFNNIRDLKFITFNDISKLKQTELINEMNLVTNTKFTDILRKNTVDKTKIISVIEDGDVVTQAIIFNSTLEKTAVFYLKGSFDPNELKQLSETNKFEELSTKLIQNYQVTPITPGFNPN